MIAVLLLLVGSVQAYVATYGEDYAGGDYNCTVWNSSSTLSPYHWVKAAKECENYCVQEESCCTWTYVTPEVGPSDPERCCLKNIRFSLVKAPTHWTGTVRDCPPGPPYPGPTHLVPQVTNSPDCDHIGGWHDIAGALYYKGQYHVFQGCPGSGGWHHAVSSDLVHWNNLGVDPGLSALPEPYGSDSPCSGFVTVDDDGIPCAGFRQCSGNWPGRDIQEVPLELRCAKNDNLTAWTGPEYIFWFYFNRPLPYDPVRPFRDFDGKWYATIAADGCNLTYTPCPEGGRAYLFTSPALRGPNAKWQMLSKPLFTSNYTVLPPNNFETVEFVTMDYIGNLYGDPLGGRTRLLFNNVPGGGISGTTAYFIGTQLPGQPFVVNFSDPYATGMVDWGAFNPSGAGKGRAGLETGKGGAFAMMRTLSTDPNQVAKPGRKIAVAWLTGIVASQSLARDFTLDPHGTGLLQQFVPELQALRRPDPMPIFSQQIEVFVQCKVRPVAKFSPFGVQVLRSKDGSDFTTVGVDYTNSLVLLADRAGPLVLDPVQTHQINIHAIIDHSIATVIVNNRTAITVFVYPRDANSNGVSLFGVDGKVVTCNLQVWNLTSVNKNSP